MQVSAGAARLRTPGRENYCASPLTFALMGLQLRALMHQYSTLGKGPRER